MITINASFKEAIDRLIYYTTEVKPLFTKEVTFDNESDKGSLINTLKDCIYFNIEGDSIICTVYTTEEEKEQYLQRYEVLRKAQLNTLKKWYNLREDYKTQLTEYLIINNLNWILDKIAEKEN